MNIRYLNKCNSILSLTYSCLFFFFKCVFCWVCSTDSSCCCHTMIISSISDLLIQQIHIPYSRLYLQFEHHRRFRLALARPLCLLCLHRIHPGTNRRNRSEHSEHDTVDTIHSPTSSLLN